MSYSRWSNSVWYTFWCYNNKSYKFKLPLKKYKDEQTFEICDFPSFLITYGEIRVKGVENIIKDVKEFYSKDHYGSIFDKYVDGEIHYKDSVFPAKNPSDDELDELVGYINEFVNDVDKDFKLWNFIKYEWGFSYFLNKIKLNLF